MIDLRITNETLNILNCINWIMAPQAGGIDVFIGTVRDHTKGKKVIRLEGEKCCSIGV